MATKKDIQKNDRKGTGAGLAAGMESENKAPKTEKQKYEEYLSRLWSHKANEAVTVEIVAAEPTPSHPNWFACGWNTSTKTKATE